MSDPTKRLAKEMRMFWRRTLKSSVERRLLRTWQSQAITATTGGLWSNFRDATAVTVSGKEIQGKAVVQKLRRHLAEVQGNRCCYCGTRLQMTAYARPIEHVLSQSEYWRFTFNYRNLAISCYDCNSVKRNNNWTSVSTASIRYPRPADCHDFFHPRYHRYEEHIRFVHVVTNDAAISVYIGQTAQGRKLCRELLSKRSRRELVISSNARLKGAIEKLQTLGDADRETHSAFDAFLSKLDETIDDLAKL